MRVGGRSVAGLALAASILSAACGVEVKDPPIEVQTRESLIGAGKILQISNTTNQPLAAVEVTIRSPAGEERVFTQESLGGFEQLEIGWKKLGGWEIPPGAEVEVRCEGYLGAVEAVVPGAGARPESSSWESSTELRRSAELRVVFGDPEAPRAAAAGAGPMVLLWGRRNLGGK